MGHDRPTVVRIEEGTGAVHVNMRVGSIMSLLGTATGRVFAAFLPPKMIENFIESGVGRASVGDEAERQMSRNQIDKAVAEVKKRALPELSKDQSLGLMPLVHRSSIIRMIALAITAIGPSHTFDADWDGPSPKNSVSVLRLYRCDWGSPPRIKGGISRNNGGILLRGVFVISNSHGAAK